MEREPSPVVVIPTTTGEVSLHWGNTLVRLFEDTSFNYAEYYPNEHQTQGLKVGQYIIDILVEHDFSYRYDKYPDEATVEWFIKAEMSVMENEIEELE